MLKLTVRPGECLSIGDDIKVVITGGTQNNYHIMVDAPKSLNIVQRQCSWKKMLAEKERQKLKKYYADEPLTKEDIRRLKAAQNR